jgi:hypothetical protein
MKNDIRPARITTVLQTIEAGDTPKISAELEAYIANLEARQPDRPVRIAAILGTIGTQYPAELQMTLDTYISSLEARQQVVLSGTNRSLVLNSEHPPVWSQQRTIERERRRRERASQKLNNYR